MGAGVRYPLFQLVTPLHPSCFEGESSMNVTQANKKAKKLSEENKTVAVVYSYFTGANYGKVEYDAALLENYEGLEDAIEIQYSCGKPLIVE